APVHRGAVRDVARQAEVTGARRRGEIQDGDAGTTRRQAVRRGGPDAGGTPGDQGHQAVEVATTGHRVTPLGAWAGAAATHTCRCRPRPSISTSTTSPGRRYGYRPDRATPSGVPVRIRSPGSRVRYWLRWYTR